MTLDKFTIKAQDYAQKMGDEFVSCEPILLALFTDGATAGLSSSSMPPDTPLIFQATSAAGTSNTPSPATLST